MKPEPGETDPAGGLVLGGQPGEAGQRGDRTVADEEVEVLIFEPAATRNTGNVEDPTFTAPQGVRL